MGKRTEAAGALEAPTRRSRKRSVERVHASEAPKQRVLAALRKIVRAIDRYSRSLVTRCDVTGPQLICLHVMQEVGSLTSRELSQKVHLDPSTLVGILDRLEQRGLISRRRDTRDRRAVQLSLTTAGRRFVRESPSPLQGTLADGLDRLSAQRQNKLAESLEEIVRLMAAEDLPAAPITPFALARKPSRSRKQPDGFDAR